MASTASGREAVLLPWHLRGFASDVARLAVAEAQARADFAEGEARAAGAVAARATEESRVASRRAGRAPFAALDIL